MIQQRKNTPELVGAPIRRQDPKANTNKSNTQNKQSLINKQNLPKRNESQNRQTPQNKNGGFNRQVIPNKPFSQNRQSQSNKPGSPIRSGQNHRQGGPYKQGDFNRTGAKFNNQKNIGVRRPVSPNELMQLQKTNKSDKEKVNKSTSDIPKVESLKQKAKAPNIRPSSLAQKNQLIKPLQIARRKLEELIGTIVQVRGIKE